MREKFDSAASQNFYGNRDCLSIVSDESPIFIEGFTADHQAVSSEGGLNVDGKRSFYVSGMPEELALLSAYLYVQDGAALLFPSEGVVLKLSAKELQSLKDYVKNFERIFNLKVVNNTYEVDRTTMNNEQEQSTYHPLSKEVAFSSTATRFFNSNVNISNSHQRILTMLLTGFSFDDVYSMVKYGSVTGLPPDLTISQLNNFSHYYGRTPDLIRLATAQQIPNRQGLMDANEKPTFVGARLEVDIMDSDYNDPSKQGKKLPTWGGAICAAVGVDCMSGYVVGKLLTKKSNTLEFIKEFVQFFQMHKHPIKKLSSDSGIVSASNFQVMTTDAIQYLYPRN
jgi:hypothetical protein